MRRTATFRIFALLFAFVLLLSSLSIPTFADNESFPDVSRAESAFLFNINTDKLIYSKSMDKKIFTGSVTKMVGGLILCEYFANRMDDAVIITDNMLANAQGAKIKLSAGDTVTFKDLLYGVVCGGGNDACYTLAFALSGSVEAFVTLMNNTVISWGATSTVFTNPSGYDDPNMYTTAEDVLIISQRAAKNKLYMDASSSLSYTIKPQNSSKELKLFNRNSLISSFYASGYQNKYAYGLIAGFTDLGQYTAITYLEKDGTEFLCGIMGAQDTYDPKEILSYKYINAISEYAFKNYKYQKIFVEDKYICTLNVNLALPEGDSEFATVDCYSSSDIYALVSPDFNIDKDVSYKYYLHHKELYAPVRQGIVVGGIDVIYDGKIIGSTQLLAGESVEENSILFSLNNMKAFFLGRFFILSVILFVFLTALYLLIDALNINLKNKIKRKK